MDFKISDTLYSIVGEPFTTLAICVNKV